MHSMTSLSAVILGRWEVICFWSPECLRSTLFGDSDALVLYSVIRCSHRSSSSLGSQNRHTYRFTRVAADPFGLPVVAFVDAIGGARRKCTYLLLETRDSDADQIPDEVEIELGTDPALPDTDGDGRTDGEEVLRDATDPLSGDVCIPIAGMCNGVDDDCDERVDELPDRECYDGPNGTAGFGQCRFGQQSCVDGRWSQCIGQVAPVLETCEGRIAMGSRMRRSLMPAIHARPQVLGFVQRA